MELILTIFLICLALATIWVIYYVTARSGWYDDEFMEQARRDQLRANYPGCARGVMKCYDFCSNSKCPFDSHPTEAWVRKRAAVLRKRAECQHTAIRPKFDRIFPEIGARGQICDNCGLMRQDENSPWEERDD